MISYPADYVVPTTTAATRHRDRRLGQRIGRAYRPDHHPGDRRHHTGLRTGAASTVAPGTPATERHGRCRRRDRHCRPAAAAAEALLATAAARPSAPRHPPTAARTHRPPTHGAGAPPRRHRASATGTAHRYRAATAARRGRPGSDPDNPTQPLGTDEAAWTAWETAAITALPT